MRSELGDFLRARRELVQPAEVGLPPSTRRRVRGLRREEVAMLAGISAEYYLRLEQGRDRTPSAQVVTALARVLRLQPEAEAHLMALSRPAPARPSRLDEPVPAGITMLLTTLNVPAFVVNRYRDVLAANPLAVALSPLMAPGVNRLVAAFTDPVAAAYHPDLAENAAAVVAQLRAEVGPDTDDPRFQSLIADLSARSPEFRALWSRHDISRGGSNTAVIHHPEAGPLHLRREKLAIVGAETLQLVMYHAEPGTPSADGLALLAGGTGSGPGCGSAPAFPAPARSHAAGA
ncbi:helix-turn-helix domain-containing protein [Actinoplanes sp. LDG1-06]|uniref:Helix-turn-helix domain-containing protein n=1 Tax=Paractinoplanes ovalisporus TaxID=2810368 RepID=A0ABS2A2L5_9ACTN|nr:helix-turn-helix transcriptional regulator [Actinoplanes ovalisporus]MBM2614077.1 helix-turn-helix domain-containing protein [Actinoplanes ovalisporus]